MDISIEQIGTTKKTIMHLTDHDDRIIGLHEVEFRTNRKKTAIYRQIKQGTFPAKTNQNGWLLSTILDFIKNSGND